MNAVWEPPKMTATDNNQITGFVNVHCKLFLHTHYVNHDSHQKNQWKRHNHSLSRLAYRGMGRFVYDILKIWGVYHIRSPSRFREKRWQTSEVKYLVDMAESLHTWTHSSWDGLHKTYTKGLLSKPAQNPRMADEVSPLTEKLLVNDGCWEQRVSFLQGCDPQRLPTL